MTVQSGSPGRRALLTVNAGSSTIKLATFSLHEPPACIQSGSLPATGNVEQDALAAAVWATDRLRGYAIHGIGHRVVLSARRPVAELITPALIATLRHACADDSEHLPLQVALMEALGASWPEAQGVACFDSAFHNSMPEVAQLLPLPTGLRAAGFERFGFHGLSCAWLMEELSRLGGPQVADGRVLLAHLGNGASITAVRHGRSVDTSMGFSPAGGLVMATRAGDLDPGAVAAICRANQLDAGALSRFVNHQAGLRAVSGTTGDLRELLERSAHDPHAALAVDLFCYQARKWVGAFAAVLGGVETLVFAGGIGEHLPEIRARICSGLEFLGVRVDPQRNASNAPIISTEDSRATVRVIATDEQAMIARITLRTMDPEGSGASQDSGLQ